MTLVALIAVAALGAAGLTFWRLSRLPKPLPAAEERTFATLQAGDVVISPDGDWLVAGREAVGQGHLIALRSGREQRWLVAGAAGPVALLQARPEGVDVDRAVAAGGRKLDRATLDLLPGVPSI